MSVTIFDRRRASGAVPVMARHTMRGALLLLALAALHCVSSAAQRVQPRLELRTLMYNYKYSRQRDLFILALSEMMEMDPDDIFSWYQIGGIHGIPGVAYDSCENWAAPYSTNLYYRWMGYCEHQSTIFPTWHRPYLLLLEKAISMRAMKIANTWNAEWGRADYQQAASELRLPYYDWGLSSAVPQALLDVNITVRAPPYGMSCTLANPLFTYKMQRPTAAPPRLSYPSNFPYRFQQSECTVRWPNASQAPVGTNVPALAAGLSGMYGRLHTQILDLLDINTWDCFGSSSVQRVNPACLFQTMEQLHNWGHSLGGGNGHLSYLETAGFDPLFFLHHSNMDRLFALWQVFHPRLTVSPGPSPLGNYYYNAGTMLTADTPLYPFRLVPGSNGPYWTSRTVMNINDLNYTYPELNYTSTSALRQQLVNMYGPVQRGFRWYIFMNCTASVSKDASSSFYLGAKVYAQVVAGISSTTRRSAEVQGPPKLEMKPPRVAQQMRRHALRRKMMAGPVQVSQTFSGELTPALRQVSNLPDVPPLDANDIRWGPAYVPFSKASVVGSCYVYDYTIGKGVEVANCQCSKTLSWSYDNRNLAYPYTDLPTGVVQRWA